MSPCLPPLSHFPSLPAVLVWYGRGGGGWGRPILEGSFNPSSLPSLSPPTRIPSSKSHHVLASVFPAALQEDKEEWHCVPCNTHPAKFTSSFTYILFSYSRSLLLSCLLFFICFPTFSLLWWATRSLIKCITLQCQCVYLCTLYAIVCPVVEVYSAVLRGHMNTQRQMEK